MNKVGQRSLAALARPSGGLAMVAMDQRESLRAMLAEHHGSPVPDETMTRFKVAVATEVAPHASGFLIDRKFGFDTVVDDHLLPDDTGLILAADSLTHPPEGGPALETSLDDTISAEAVRDRGVVALKLMIVWRPDDRRDKRLAMAEEFVQRCARAGVVSILEGVVRHAEHDFDKLLLDAAAELGALRPTLYKTQVPRRGEGDPAGVSTVCEQVTATVPVPWVVVSQGVSITEFPNAVRLACQGGASGFLAGRAIWSDTLGDPVPLLRSRSLDRLHRLADVVDRTARPWREAA